MLEKGACAVVTERPLGLPAEICVNESRRLYPELLSAFYGRPTQKLCLGAVTGTNGKTTTTYLLKAILEQELGAKVGLIGTNRNLIGALELPAHRTTPEPYELQALLRRMADRGELLLTGKRYALPPQKKPLEAN